MADEIITAEEPIVSSELSAEQVAFQEQMNYQFDDNISLNQPPAEPAAIETVAPLIEPEITTPIDYLKELGYETIDAAKQEIAELKKIKEQPPTEKEIEFANEKSKKMYELFRQGKLKEIKANLDAEELVSGVETMTPEQKLKLYIKLQNPRFDQELIEDEYQSLYSIDEESFYDDPMKLRKEKIRLEQRIENDVNKAAEFFVQYQQKAELPDISPVQTTIDEDYEGWKASTATSNQFHSEVLVPSITALTEDALKMNFNVNDANNQMQFGVSITPDKADLEQVKQASTNLLGYVTSIAYDKDGNFIPNALANLILRNQYFDKYAQSIARQAVNAERIRVVESNKGDSGQRRDVNSPVERSEFQKNMEFALS